MTTPVALGWGTPPVAPGQLVQVACPGIALRVRREVAPLFAELIVRMNATTHPGFMTSSGGYNFRPMRGSETAWDRTKNPVFLSRHSYGLAGDFRAGTNPGYSSRACDMPKGTSAIAASVGLSWGGDWKDPYDPMHFEFLGSVEQAAVWCERLRRSRQLLGAVVTTPFTDEEKARILRAADCVIRALDTEQPSLIDPTKKYWATQYLQFIDAATNRTEKLLGKLVK